MIEFTYTNYAPPAARPKTNTNQIRLWRDENGVLKYDRRYVSADGTVSDVPIEHDFEETDSPETVAKMIHWGCCGWSAGGHQIWALIQRVRHFMEQCQHDAYIGLNPRKAGWLVYCADCPQCAVGDTAEEAAQNWKAGITLEIQHDRTELVNFKSLG